MTDLPDHGSLHLNQVGFQLGPNVLQFGFRHTEHIAGTDDTWSDLRNVRAPVRCNFRWPVEILKTEGVTLDMTPISNVKLMAVPSMGEHPIRQFMGAGINCTISTDDPMLFGNSLNGEYMALAKDAGFTRRDLVQLARNGFAVADLPTEKKQEFLARLDQALDRSAEDQNSRL